MVEKEADLDFPEIDLSLRAPEIYFPLNIKDSKKDLFVVDLGNLSVRIW